MLPVSLIFTSGVASGVNSYAAVLVLGLLGRFGHIGAIPPVLERPSVLAAAAVLYIGQFVVGKIPMLDSVWDVVHTIIRPVVGGAIGVVMAQHADANSAATIAAATLGGGSALASHVVKTGTRLGINASPEPIQQHRRQPARGPRRGESRVVRRFPPGRRGSSRSRGAGGRHYPVRAPGLADPPELAPPPRGSPARPGAASRPGDGSCYGSTARLTKALSFVRLRERAFPGHAATSSR
jgi:hypothetical protein